MELKLSELDFENIGSWPITSKVFLIGFACVALCIMGYFLDISPLLEELDEKQIQEQKLRKEFQEKQKKSQSFEAYKEQMDLIKDSVGALLMQLPEQAEVPALVEDISHQGIASGLEFRSIKLLPEKQIDFYKELPIQMVVKGTYHQLADFVSNIASLPRIVTLHDFSIKPSSEKSSELLSMEITVKTYRHSEQKTLELNTHKILEPYVAFTYSAKELKDPFLIPAPVLDDGLGGVNELTPNTARPKEVLESFPLDSLRMVGILWKGSQHFALIADKGSMIYRVAVGDYMGKDHGKIIKIEEESVVIKEIVATGQGGWQERETILSLNP